MMPARNAAAAIITTNVPCKPCMVLASSSPPRSEDQVAAARGWRLLEYANSLSFPATVTDDGGKWGISGRLVDPYIPRMLWRTSPARSRRAPPIGFIHPRQPTRPNPSAGPGLLHEVMHEGFRILARSSNAVRHAALGSAAISRADNQLTGCAGASLDFRQNAKFSRVRMASACAPRSGLLDTPPRVSDHPAKPCEARRWMSAGGFAVLGSANTRRSSGTTRSTRTCCRG